MNAIVIPPVGFQPDRTSDRERIAADVEAFLKRKGNKIEVLPSMGPPPERAVPVYGRPGRPKKGEPKRSDAYGSDDDLE